MQYWRKEQLVWEEYSSEENPLLFHFLREKQKNTFGDNGKAGEAYREPGPLRIALAGAGGKTTLLMALKEECRKAGKKTIVTTTTHMFLPEARLTGSELETGESGYTFNKQQEERNVWKKQSWESSGVIYLGSPAKPGIRQGTWIKCSAPSRVLAEQWEREAEVILTEADGSRGMPVKVPAEWEPVIPEDADVILVVCGLSALGQEIGRVCQRAELLDPETAGRFGGIVEEAFLAEGMRRNYLEPLRQKYPGAWITAVWNQADTPEIRESAKRVALLCDWPNQLITTR